MKKYWKIIGIAAATAAVLYYPAMKLYEYLRDRNETDEEDADGEVRVKAFSPAYRGKHKPHHRHAPDNGTTGTA